LIATAAGARREIDGPSRRESLARPKNLGTARRTRNRHEFWRPQARHGSGFAGALEKKQDSLSCCKKGEMSEKSEAPTEQPTDLIGLARLVRSANSQPATAVPNGKKWGHSVILELIRRELLARFSDRLSMEQIAECSHALAGAIASERNPPRPSAGSKRAVRGIFERPPNSGIWWISYCDAEGKRHREKVGARSAAIDAVNRRRLEVKEGRFVPPRAAARLTFRDLAKAAMAQKKLRLAPLSYETDRLRLEKLLPLIGNVPADRLTADRIEEALAHFCVSGRSVGGPTGNPTANRYRSLISSIYSFAVRAGKMTTNPVSRVKRFRENASRVRWLTDEEEERIRAVLTTDTHRWEFDLTLHTGMRRGENFWLRWKDVDVERGNLTVKGKTGQRHIVANETAIAALRKLHMRSGDKEFVCPDNDGRAKRDWRRWFEEAVREANVPDFHFHDLRHTFASRLVMAGVDIRTVQELLGHKSIVQTMRYAHLARDHRQAAVEKMIPREARA
jgi:integrase